MKRRLMTEGEINAALTRLEGWSVKENALHKRYEFADFAAALEFVNKAAAQAEAADHHPDIKLGWGYAEFAITTHDCGGITELDISLAQEIDRVKI